MPTPIVVPANSLWEVRMNGFIDLEQTITTFHYINIDVVTDMEAVTTELAGQFGVDAWNALIKPALSVKYEFVYIDAQCIRPIRYRSKRYLPASRAGTVAGDCLPTGNSIVVRRTMPQSGRKYQGRIYLPGIARSSVVESTVTTGWSAANKANVEQACFQSLTLIAGGEFRAVLYHPGAVGLADEITDAKLDIYVRYQRRREIGVGI